ncbi:MAG: ABC transporter ATP-binding protein [Gammaproteobacteria bacterium]|jgi:ATP-binding cassette subfamily B protein|nr:ABC transporter ATP-binding protein [Gammaproteobacteria bacterium]MBP6050789.1 ABC transporter ATP-binding protein [Pseudomonadales bacterium]MBK6584423.1 ABC transporter ATP-binding protein [Gammaproteobacteria bacterium]MBK7520882.1 ABC transporter ATP-binding protein [Gammaproteobacteria bacterium]MBK7727873.1 ABC transporter ATP-binding protein [Gammaproteobacteria bacterium]
MRPLAGIEWTWLGSFLRPQRAAIAALLGLSLGVSALALVQPFITKLLIDDGLIARDFPKLLQFAILIFVIGLAASLLGGINRYFYTRVSARILFAIRESVFAHLQRLSPAFYARNRGGDILSRLDGDVAEIQRFSIDSLFAGISGVFGLLGTVAFMLYLSPQLSLLVLTLVPIQWLYLRFMRERVRDGVRRVRERSADLSAFLMETLPAIKYIQGVAATEREQQRLGQFNRAYLKDLLALQLTEFATSAVPSNLTSALRATVFIAGGYQVIQGSMALGSLIAFSTYLGMAMGPVQSLLGVYMALNRVRVSAERVRFLTTARPDVDATGTIAPHDGAAVEIRLEDLGFRYPGSGEFVLRHASVCLPPGKKIGLCGPSGSGKTTLLDLLLRHYDPVEGCIRIGGVDLRELELAGWRRRVAFVAQDIVLFRGSMRENIRYANPAADAASVRRAVQLANLDELVARLPQGLDTAIGERGARLSGGERQRIAIARALLQHPLLIVFDEATSAVDNDAEALLMGELDRLFPSTTRLIISHRERPLENTDLLLEMRDGVLRQIAP